MSKNTTLLGIFDFLEFIQNYLVTQNRAELVPILPMSKNTTLLGIFNFFFKFIQNFLVTQNRAELVPILPGSNKKARETAQNTTLCRYYFFN